MSEEIAAILRNKPLEEIINQWNEDLNDQLISFHRQAKDISAWDKTVTDNGDRIAQTYEELLQLESTQKEIDQSLEYIDSQQQELNKLLDVLGQQINTLVDQSPQVQPADEEREKAYNLAESINHQLDEMSRTLSSMIQDMNLSFEKSSDPDSPMYQIVKILNAHLNSLQWIEQTVESLHQKLKHPLREDRHFLRHEFQDVYIHIMGIEGGSTEGHGQEHIAMDLMSKADKKLKASSFWVFGSSGAKYEDAAELYTRAANTFKLMKRWREAADGFSKSAECYLNLQSKHDAATSYVSAASCLKKSEAQDAIRYYKLAIDLYTDIGRFAIAAKYQKEIAELYESDLVDLEGAMHAYQVAADWYGAEDASSTANSCLIKVAIFAAQLEHYERAINLFEQVAAASINNNLLKFSVKDYFLKAGLCRMCVGDWISVRRALNRYTEMDMSFSSTREYEFLKNILDACEQEDLDAFTEHVTEFDQLTKLDPWKTTLLLRAKKSLQEEPSLT